MAATHEVTNQVPPLVGHDTSADPALREGLEREGAGWALDEVSAPRAAGRHGGGAGAGPAGRARPPRSCTPTTATATASTRSSTTPAYHELMRTAVDHGLHGAPWADDRPGAHVARAAKFAGLERRRRATAARSR